MIKFLLFILCGFVLTSEQNHFVIDRYLDDQYIINYSIDSDLNIEEKGDFKSITSSSGYTSIIGMPKLPTYSTAFMLDPLKEYSITYEVLSSRIINNIKVIPNQHIENGLEKEIISTVDYDFYNSDRTYPYVNVSMSEPMVLRDMIISYISVIPFKYSPLLNELEVYDSIQIKINEVGNKQDIRKRDLLKSRVFEQVYKNPYMTENTILVGFRGSNFLETGAVYAPYVPLIMTPLVYDPSDFTPRKGVMTRYAKKMVRPEFYGKIYCSDLNLI